MRSRSEAEKEEVDMNNAPVARFGGRRDTEYSFGDLEEQVKLAHELVDKDIIGSRSDTSDAGSYARSEGLFECSSSCSKEEKNGFANDAAVAHFGGRFDTTFSFGDPEEQAALPHGLTLKERVGSGINCADERAIPTFGNRVELGEQSSRPWESLAKAGVESRDDAVSVGAGMDRQFSFGNPVEQTVWPSELAVIGQVACVQGSVLGSVLCGSGARAARRFRDRVVAEDGRNCSSLLSTTQSTKPSPQTSVPDTAVMVNAQPPRSVQPEPRARPELTVDVPKRRSVKPEPRAMPGASSSSSNAAVACAPRRRSVKPTPRKRGGDTSNQGVEVVDAEIATCAVVGQAEEAPTRDGTFETQASDPRPSFGAEPCLSGESFGWGQIAINDDRRE
eukprot:TRINITY_DN13617_c1_g1_i7.p1 TRINITY_DN13617_c1_g1~~TRINITY_DN13617_c1_g1_i7.p1  ORF type:complete len:391 (-),score=47.15 TRINITY_DN13617_c1_g1_i7:1163-2335(-)